MAYDTRRAAVASLREFSSWLRQKHKIVKFWSEQKQAHRYSRVFVP